MPPPLAKVKPGDALAIPAIAYNAFVDAAKANQRNDGAFLQVPQSAFQQSGIVLVRNDSGADRERFDVLGIDVPVFDPSDDEDAFKNRVVLSGLTPTEADHLGKFAVLLEPIAGGEIGRACISGVCPAWVNVQAADDSFADVYDGDATQLKSGSAGAAQILWKAEGTGPQWAVVRLGPAAAPAVRWGVLTADWDINLRPNYVYVHPCSQDGSGVDTSSAVKVFLYWPDIGPHLQPTRVLMAEDLLPYQPIGSASDGSPQGAALPIGLWPVFGKVKENWGDGNNYVTVRLCDEDGTEIGYTADVKCWLFSPENLANVKGVKLVAGDLIRIETPKYDAGTGVVIAHALNAYAGGTKSKLLDGDQHTDTVVHNAVKGDIIFSSANGTWNALPIQADNSILTAWNGIPDWFAPGAPQDLLYVDANGDLDWFAAGGNGSLLTVAAGALSWLGPGGDKQVLTTAVAGGVTTIGWQNPAMPPGGYNGQITVLTDATIAGNSIQFSNVTLDYVNGQLVGMDTNPPIVLDGTDCSSTGG